MRYAIVENGSVVNCVESDPEFAEAQGWIPAGNAAIGDIWDGDTFIKPDPPPAPPPDYSAVVANSYSTRLAARASKLDKQGRSFEAAKLLIKANEVKADG